MNDLTVIYYTANFVDPEFLAITMGHLVQAVDEKSIISISHKPIKLGQNVVVDLPRHHLSIYRQALIGAKLAKTKYIALAEDDVLYSPEHFEYRPSEGVFAYNFAVWGVFTWVKPAMFTHKAHGRRAMLNLICERELFIEAMEERFARWPDDDKIDIGIWAEPGKYEGLLRVTERKTEEFYTSIPNIVFSHETALAYNNLGKRKKLGQFRALEIPYWGRAENILELYKHKR